MLGEVLLQLVLQRRFVRGELLAVVRREVDRVLVRDVHPRDGHGAVVVHLLRELPRELDWLHVGAKCSPEDALEEGLDLPLDRAENHLGDVISRRAMLTHSKAPLAAPPSGRMGFAHASV